jgi:2-methylisocitrate lyase-like PEP mutase family enzyme
MNRMCDESKALSNHECATAERKAAYFQALHTQQQPFVIANAFDGGSARILAKLGFRALATWSAACAATLGRLDGSVTRDEALTHACAIATATECPVSADLENGFGHAPAVVADTVRVAAAAGLAGCSIDDSTGDPSAPRYDIQCAAERIVAAVEAARAAPFPFTLTARAENFVHGDASLSDTIDRLQAYERAGADVLFAPDLPDLAAARTVCASVSRPVNFMVGLKVTSYTIAELKDAGVSRISLSWSLYRAAMSGLLAAVSGIHDMGTFSYVNQIMSSSDMRTFLC